MSRQVQYSQPSLPAPVPTAVPVPAKIKLKVVFDNSTKRVIYAEAGKDFVDFLCGLLTLKVSSVVRLLTKDKMVGCLGELYCSLENFSSAYWLSNADKVQLLRPMPSDSPTSQNTLALLRYDGLLTSAGTSVGTGYVKGGEAVYMVTDDLVITPLETRYLVKVLRSVNINGTHQLEERSLEFGAEEGLNLIRASLGSKTVLTDLFKGSPHEPSYHGYR